MFLRISLSYILEEAISYDFKCKKQTNKEFLEKSIPLFCEHIKWSYYIPNKFYNL